MPGTNFKNGVYSWGLPVGLAEGVGNPLGKTFFVQSTHSSANDNNSGERAERPLATLQAAENKVTASAYDRIYVLPGHAETYAAAAALVFNVAGVEVIGIGRGTLMPRFTFATEVLTDIDIDAANVILRNLHFRGNIAALAAPIDVNAAGFIMEDCKFTAAGATTDFDITVITDAAAEDMAIRRCRFLLEYSDAAAGVILSNTMTEVIRLVGVDRAIIEDCELYGNFTTAAINAVTTACRDIRISRNKIRNVQTTNIAGIIDLVAGCTGVVDENVGFHGYTTDLATTIDPASCAMIRNYFSNVVTEAGGLVGTAST